MIPMRNEWFYSGYFRPNTIRPATTGRLTRRECFRSNHCRSNPIHLARSRPTMKRVWSRPIDCRADSSALGPSMRRTATELFRSVPGRPESDAPSRSSHKTMWEWALSIYYHSMSTIRGSSKRPMPVGWSRPTDCLATATTFRVVKAPNEAGMVPFKSLADNDRSLRADKEDANDDDGMIPVKKLLNRYKSVRAVNDGLNSDGGIVPDSASRRRMVKFSNDDGMVPTSSSESTNSRSVRPVKSARSSGM
jgi:hypothetical protein